MKLIVTDMDGTLLNDNKEIDNDFFKIMALLKPKGVKFAIASGRHLNKLKAMFNDDSLIYISENGAVVEENGQIIYENCLSKETVKTVCDVIDKIPDFSIVYSTYDKTYLKSDDPLVIEEVSRFSPAIILTDDVLKIEEKCIKIAVYDKKANTKESVKELLCLKDVVTIATSSENWIDLNALGVSKGEALKAIKERYRLDAQDLIVFGDYNNDLTMMKEAYYSYAMANATKEVKEAANFTCLSNNEGGVCKKLRELFKNDL